MYDPREGVLLATEIESTLNRIEQLVRWSGEKASSLPSWDGWSQLGEPPQVSRLLVVRRTRATRDAATAAASQLLLAYPAHAADALRALSRMAHWPGPSLVWARVESGGVHLLDRR